MPTRLSTQERKAQIVLAALNLLSTVSVDCLTTRMVAGAIGVSQPALFKHFASRDAILHAVMDHVRSSLESSVKTVFSTAKGAHEVAQGLLEGLFRFAEAFPGAPRLLFYDAATSGNEAPPSLHAQLLLIVSRQTTLVTELVRDEIAAGTIPETVDAGRAGELFVALLQGELLRWHLDSSARSLLDRAPGIVDFWWAGLLAGQPQSVNECNSVRSRVAKEALVELDVRPLLEAGVDPFEAITDTLGTLQPNGSLVLVAPFRPGPLIAVLEGRGHTVDSGEPTGGLFTILISSKPDSGEPIQSLLDLRDLPMPEPLEAILVAAESMLPGEFTLARLPRFPRLLIPMLESRGIVWSCVEEPCGAAIFHIARPSA